VCSRARVRVRVCRAVAQGRAISASARLCYASSEVPTEATVSSNLRKSLRGDLCAAGPLRHIYSNRSAQSARGVFQRCAVRGVRAFLLFCRVEANPVGADSHAGVTVAMGAEGRAGTKPWLLQLEHDWSIAVTALVEPASGRRDGPRLISCPWRKPACCCASMLDRLARPRYCQYRYRFYSRSSSEISRYE